jgi:hypothetical protein
VAFNLRKGSSDVLPAGNFKLDDPNQWKPKLTAASDLQAGKALWENAKLKESPLSSETLVASCSACHAVDGRDLKYFNYSDWSIESRSQFHGLSERQAQQISSYIRSLDLNLPAGKNVVAQARPWNPPYQPGVGLDAKPVEEWAAGAGLSAVLNSDAEMMPYLFPNGASMTSVIDSRKTLNVREMPIALQLPDWNAWLPEVHPSDIWPGFEREAPYVAYQNSRGQLQTSGVESLIAQKQLLEILNNINGSSRRFIEDGAGDAGADGEVWRTTAGKNLPAGLSASERETRKLSLAQWSAVKQWELATGFKLEDDTSKILANGEARAWPSKGQSVHPLAPHITADDTQSGFTWQSTLVGKYNSTAWYQLQMTLNAGQRQLVNVQPQDWPYQLRHVREFSEVAGVQQPLRMTQSIIKAYQARDNGVGPSVLNGWQLRSLHPWWAYGDPSKGGTEFWDQLDTIRPGLRRQVLEGFLEEFLRMINSFQEGDWTRCASKAAGTSRWFCVDDIDYVPKLPKSFFSFPENNHADSFYRLLPLLKQSGVQPALVKQMLNWCQKMWPQGDWDAQLNRTVSIKPNSKPKK